MIKVIEKIKKITNFKYPGDEDFDSESPDDLNLELFMFLGILEETIKSIGSLFEDTNELKKRICYALVNRDSELIEDSPTREHFDMNVVYFVALEVNEDIYHEIPITNELCDELRISEDELYNYAKINTPRIYPLQVAQNDVLKHSLNEHLNIDREILVNMSICSNELMTHGASCLLYDETIEYLCEYLTGNILVLPISCYKILVCITNDTPATIKNKLKEFLIEINKKTSAESLSDQILIFDRSKQVLEIL